MKTLIEQIQSGHGENVVNTIKSTLGKKTVAAVKEHKKQVVQEVYGDESEGENTDRLIGKKVKSIEHGTVGYAHHHNPSKTFVWVSDKPDGSSGQYYHHSDLKLHEAMINEAIPYPEKSKHLKDYKVVTPKDDPNYDKEWKLEHPEGHKLTWNRTNNTFVHTSPGVAKAKTGRMVDLHPHLMKVHNKFDDQVKDYVSRYGGGFVDMNKLHSLMGALEYKSKKSDYSGDREEDAIRYKAMHRALLDLQKRHN